MWVVKSHGSSGSISWTSSEVQFIRWKQEHMCINYRLKQQPTSPINNLLILQLVKIVHSFLPNMLTTIYIDLPSKSRTRNMCGGQHLEDPSLETHVLMLWQSCQLVLVLEELTIVGIATSSRRHSDFWQVMDVTFSIESFAFIPLERQEKHLQQ
jgi:hypothetical protein